MLREGRAANFKPVTAVIDAPPLSPEMRKFLDWIAWYTLAPKGSALAMGLKLAGCRPAGGAARRRPAGRAAAEAHDAGAPEGASVAQGGVVRLKASSPMRPASASAWSTA